MATDNTCLNEIMTTLSGEVPEKVDEIQFQNNPTNIVRDTETLLHSITVADAPAGTYEINYNLFASYDTTRNKYEIRHASTTHTINIPTVVHEPKDSHEVNPEYVRFFFYHAGGDINFSYSVFHSTANTMTVHSSDLRVVRIK